MRSSDRERRSSDDLLKDLHDALDPVKQRQSVGDARLDFRRATRTGTPEIILAENKTVEQIIRLTGEMLEQTGSVLLSRISSTDFKAIEQSFSAVVIERPPGSSMVRVAKNPEGNSELNGKVAIFTAGTSDLPRADEVRLVVNEMGVDARVWADMGVAGLHRLIQPFREAVDWGASAIVVVAGMDGALPSVIAGLSPVPVIGLPVSVGYGYGGKGEGALMAMLQSCAPGLTVVNIDNSVGAGISAARIARQSFDAG
jgi:pyridinium-3,5-biscarboxylic acid mononucleotide synthase